MYLKTLDWEQLTDRQKGQKAKQFREQHKDTIISEYQEGYSLKYICEKYGLPRCSTERFFIQNNIVLRTLVTMHTDIMKNIYIKKCLEKYGVTNAAKRPENRERVRKYNRENKNSITQKHSWSHYILGRGVHPNKKKEFQVWKEKTLHLTKINKKNVQQPTHCYYTNIRFDMSKSNGDFYPSLDHKISLVRGFDNGNLPEEIANINNMCYCCRYCNSLKKHLTEKEFQNTNMIKKIIEYYESINAKV